MKLFKKKKKQSTTGDYFVEDSLDAQFKKIMEWAKDLNRKDFNKLKNAMDKDYDAYQILHGIEPVDEDIKNNDVGQFELADEEVK